MSLTIGTGPFGPHNSGAFNFDTGALKEHTLYLQESPKRVRATFGGETVVDSRRAKLLHETGHLPVYYFPEEDVRTDLLAESDRTTHSPFKGDASYRSVSPFLVSRARRPSSRRWPGSQSAPLCCGPSVGRGSPPSGEAKPVVRPVSPISAVLVKTIGAVDIRCSSRHRRDRRRPSKWTPGELPVRSTSVQEPASASGLQLPTCCIRRPPSAWRCLRCTAERRSAEVEPLGPGRRSAGGTDPTADRSSLARCGSDDAIWASIGAKQVSLTRAFSPPFGGMNATSTARTANVAGGPAASAGPSAAPLPPTAPPLSCTTSTEENRMTSISTHDVAQVL